MEVDSQIDILQISDRIIINLNDPICKDEDIFRGELIKLRKKVAVKRVKKDEYPDYRERIEKELKAVREIDQEKVSRLIDVKDYEIEQDKEFCYIAYDLFDKTLKNIITHTDFRNVKQILKDSVEGLKYLHSKDIIHRDIRPQNIYVQNNNGKLSNHALSKELQPGCLFQSVSRPFPQTGYIATELYSTYLADEKRSNKKRKKTINCTVDIFSMGIIFYETLTGGIHPYRRKGGDEQENINNTKFKVNFEIFNKVKVKLEKWEIPLAKQLISSMLQSSPGKRPSADEILKHPFFWNIEESTPQMGSFTVVEKFFKVISNFVHGSKDLESRLYEEEFENWGLYVHNFIIKFLEDGISDKDPNKNSKVQENLKGASKLLRLIRNLEGHSDERVKDQLRNDFRNVGFDSYTPYILSKFPNFLFHVYKVMQEFYKYDTIKGFYCKFDFNRF